MSEMKPRQISAPSIVNRVSTAQIVNHYQYAESGVEYEQDLVTYEFFDYRGDLVPRERNAATMKGR